MGIRETQILGLTIEGQEFLDANVQREKLRCSCPDCRTEHVNSPRSKVYASARHEGMFEDGPELFEYDLKDGRIAREVVQQTVWSSGPCIFLCLEIEGKRMFEWPSKEIQRA